MTTPTHTVADVLHPDDIPADLAERKELREGKAERFVCERRWLRADGTAIWVIHSKVLLRDDDGSPLYYVAHVQDNTAAHRDRDELTRRASHDALTGLINREEMLARLTEILARSPKDGTNPGVLFCDVDLFKHVNDTLGHATGDEVLRAIGRRIAASLRRGDMAARLGGDEFVVVLEDVPDKSAAVQVAERIRRATGQPLAIKDVGRVVTSTMSVGVALSSPGVSANELMNNADLALYRAKEAGRDQIAVVDNFSASEEHADVSHGLANGEFVPWFQPIAELADGRLAGYKAVARRVRADGSVREVERSKLGAGGPSWISDIDMAVIRKALEGIGDTHTTLHLAANISAGTIARSDFAQLTIRCLEEAGVDPARLHLELGESVLMGATGSARSTICDLSDIGVRWYVDDFGSGYSSVSPLLNLPIAGIKLDPSYTTAIGSGNPSRERVVRALPLLANGLGLDTVAQGVGTEEEAQVLLSYGWKHGQGSFFGRPSSTLAPLNGR